MAEPKLDDNITDPTIVDKILSHIRQSRAPPADADCPTMTPAPTSKKSTNHAYFLLND